MVHRAAFSGSNWSRARNKLRTQSTLVRLGTGEGGGGGGGGGGSGGATKVIPVVAVSGASGNKTQPLNLRSWGRGGEDGPSTS